MKLIRKQRNGFALFFIASICLAVWLGAAIMVEAACAIGAIAVVSFIFLVRQNRLLHDAVLIWDNRILVVSSAFISMVGHQGENNTEETVVSTFGMLIGSRVYRWGCDGVHGVRLNAVVIDKERMYLTFGDVAQTMRVELLHGMVEQQPVLDVMQKLWYETGVKASVSGW